MRSWMKKNLFSIAMPMTKDKAVLEANHEKLQMTLKVI